MVLLNEKAVESRKNTADHRLHPVNGMSDGLLQNRMADVTYDHAF